MIQREKETNQFLILNVLIDQLDLHKKEFAF